MPSLDFVSLFPIVLGLLLVFFGRKMFWLFIGASIFLAIMSLVPRYVHHHDALIFYIAVGVAVVAGIAGVFLQKILLRVAGFLVGGFIFFSLWQNFASAESLPWWLPFVVGGILGAILLSVLFEWALIALSSVAGAFLILQAFSIGAMTRVPLLVILVVLGIIVQGKAKRSTRKKAAAT